MKKLVNRVQWQINAIRHRDPLSPRSFRKLFGSWKSRSWDPRRSPRRVLILRSDEIGDTVTTLTLLAAMRKQWPQAQLHLVVKPGPAAVFASALSVDRVIRWTPITEGSALKRQVLTARQALLRFGVRGYDLAVLPRWDFDDTPLRYLAAASRARSIVGFLPVTEREPVWFGAQRELLDGVISRGSTPLLSVQQLRRVADFLGVAWPERWAPPVGLDLFDEDDARVAADKAPLPEDCSVVVSVGIGARDAKRQWPVNELVRTLSAVGSTRKLFVEILGGDVDSARATEFLAKLTERGIAGVHLAGALSLSQSAAAIARSDVFIGNDSGLQHIASSLDVPTVVVTCHPATGSPWSDNAPERFGPWATHSVLLQPAHPADGCVDECVAREPHCILGVSSESVVAAVAEMLDLRTSAVG